jgi:hypothetical protein
MDYLLHNLWRRAIELFLLACMRGNDGALPLKEEMDKTLCLPVDKMLEDFHDLVEIGVMDKMGSTKWVMTHFSKRQAAILVVEQVRRSRDSNKYIINRNNFCNKGEVDSSSGEVQIF